MTKLSPVSDDSKQSDSSQTDQSDAESFEGIDLRDVFLRINRGLTATFGLAFLGIAVAAIIFAAFSPVTTTTTSMRVNFSFSGYGKGEYPVHSKFTADDIRAPDIISKALEHEGLDASENFQGKIRSAITVEGIFPINEIKERDRLRAAGQEPPPFLPDEYLVTLTLPRKFPLASQQRERLLNEVVSAYIEKFQRTYAELPETFGDAFNSLRNADYFQYELILNKETQKITYYLSQELDRAKMYRSPTTNLSFSDLLAQTELFEQIQMDGTLGLIRKNSIAKDRATALVKMDYYLRTLEDQEQEAAGKEKVVNDLLNRTQEQSRNYVLGIKSEANQSRTEAPILDQGLIDSLLANDSANFLVRQALAAGLELKTIESEKARVLERRKDMETMLNSDPEVHAAVLDQVNNSLGTMETSYNQLIVNIRQTTADFFRQQYADAIRIQMQPQTTSIYRTVAAIGAIGGLVGAALGLGLSLLGIYIGDRK
jgi:hypothetical protein